MLGALNPSFRISVPGKWILSGEHAVLRGHPAVALPHREYRLELQFEKRETPPFEVDPPQLAPLLGVLLDRLCARWASLMEPRGPIHGKLTLSSTIPEGAGFGSSAALCHAVAAWFSARHGIATHHLFEMASRLEDHFHGKSSGLDIAVVSSDSPILYRRGQGPERLRLSSLPRFSFHDSGVRAPTQKCIARVEAFFDEAPAEALRWDETMGACADRTAALLRAYAEEPTRRVQTCRALADAMNGAQDCFRAWGLVPPEAEALEAKLRSQGALGVKLTGAGGGGFLVALWGE